MFRCDIHEIRGAAREQRGAVVMSHFLRKVHCDLSRNSSFRNINHMTHLWRAPGKVLSTQRWRYETTLPDTHEDIAGCFRGQEKPYPRWPGVKF